MSILFKVISWSLGFIILAKGNSKLYLISELISNSLLFVFVVFGYKFFGLTGVGIAYSLYHIIDLVIINFVIFKKYKIHFHLNVKLLFYMCLGQCLIMLFLIKIENSLLKYILVFIGILFSLFISIKKINNFISFKEIINNKLKF